MTWSRRATLPISTLPGGAKSPQQFACPGPGADHGECREVDPIRDIHHLGRSNAHPLSEPGLQVWRHRNISPNQRRQPTPQPARYLGLFPSGSDTSRPCSAWTSRARRPISPSVPDPACRCYRSAPGPASAPATPARTGNSKASPCRLLFQRHARNNGILDFVPKRTKAVQRNHRMPVTIAVGLIRDTTCAPCPRYPGGRARARSAACRSRLIPGSDLLLRARGSAMPVAGSACANARRSTRAWSTPPWPIGDDNAHTDDRGTFPRSTSHACNNLVSSL